MIFTTVMMMTVAVVIVINVYMMQVAMNRVLATCKNNITFYIFCFTWLLNFILKEWCTISRGAKPHAQKANDEKVLKKVVHTIGLFRDERSDGPK